MLSAVGPIILATFVIGAVVSFFVVKGVKLIHQRNEMRELLKRIRQWDMLDTGDGSYWKRKIDRVLKGNRND